MGGLTEYVFGYGSLAGELAPDGRLARLRGYRRVWGVAADNRRAIPGYKQYRLRSDGTAPAVFVAFLDVVEDPGTDVNGTLAPADAELLAELDLRERNYDRIDVTDSIADAPQGRIWTYAGSSAGRARLAEGLAGEQVVAVSDYVDAVHAAFRGHGDDEYRHFLASSTFDGLPALDLERVDLPPEAPR